MKNFFTILHGVRSLPDLSIRQLEYLVAVSEAPTFTVAAARVGVTASALSQGLAELERRIGVELFERHGRRRRLRTAARPVLDHARQVLGLTSDLVHWADQVRDASVGRVRVGMIDAAAVLYFPELLRSFRTSHPGVALHLTVAPSREQLELLTNGELDLAVCVGPPAPPPGVELTDLMVDELAVYPPSGERPGPPSTWGPWVLFPPDSHTRRLVVDALAAKGAPIEVVGESNQPDVLREMVLLGMGWTVLPTAHAEQGERPLPAGHRLLDRHLVIARRSGAVVDPAVDVLADDLLAAADR